MTPDVPLPDLSLNPSAQVDVRRIGSENHPLLVVDQVLLHPDEMRAYAIDHGRFRDPPEGSYYPGRNGVLPGGYGAALCNALRPFLERVFGLPRGFGLTHEGFFGIATFSPERLQPLQTIPHFDAVNPFRIACVHYLCGPPYNGTAFYRHDATGFESVNARRVDAYRDAIFAELEARVEASTSHVSGDIAGFTQVEAIEASFNRLIVYRATSLHAGVLGTTELGQGPDDGRLTANSFIEAVRPTR